MTTLTYVLATENGQYNPTIPWQHLHVALNIYSRYKAVNFVRINSWDAASLRIVNAKSLDAWATYSYAKRTIRMHPTVNYGNNPTILAKVIQHECGHFRNSSHHNNRNGLMHPTAGDVFNWAQIDDPWWNHRPWRGSLRPWSEPNYFRDVFASPKVTRLLGADSPSIATEDADIRFECACTRNSLWSRIKRLFTPEPKIVSVAEATRSELSMLADCVKCIHE